MKRLGTGAPDVATTELMAFTTGAFYLAGGTAAALSTVPSWHSWSTLKPTTAALLILAGVAVTAGAALLIWGGSLPRWSFHAVVGCASAMLATGVVLSDSLTAAVMVAAVFVFCAVDILYFFQGRQALVQTLLLVAAVAGSTYARGLHPAHIAALLLIQLAVIVVIGRLVMRAAHGGRDALTGLPNRRAFDERLQQAVPAAVRSGAPLSVALIDVDHFKAVNDHGGHPAGDALLRRVAQVWSSQLPTGVFLARQGGDEFALLSVGLSDSQVGLLCQRLHMQAAPVTVSVGVARLENTMGVPEGAAEVVRRADSALYAAKNAGRACTRFSLASGAAERTWMEQDRPPRPRAAEFPQAFTA